MYEELGWGPLFCFLHLPGKGGWHFIWKRIPPKPSFHLGKAKLWRSSKEARRYVFPDSRWLSTLFTFPDSVQLRFTCSCLQWAMLIKPVLYWHRNTCRNSSWFFFSAPLPHSVLLFCNRATPSNIWQFQAKACWCSWLFTDNSLSFCEAHTFLENKTKYTLTLEQCPPTLWKLLRHVLLLVNKLTAQNSQKLKGWDEGLCI